MVTMSNDVKWNAVLQSGEWWHEVELSERDKLQLNWVVIRSNDVEPDDTPPVWLSLDVLPEVFIHNCGWCTHKTWCDGCEASQARAIASEVPLSPSPKELIALNKRGDGKTIVRVPIDPQPKHMGGDSWEFDGWIEFDDLLASHLLHDHYGNDLAKEVLGVEAGNVHPIRTGYGIVPDDTLLLVQDIIAVLSDMVWYWELSVEVMPA